MNEKEIFEIGAQCLLRVGNRFFAVVEIESEVPGVDLEVFVIIRINIETAKRLKDAGLDFCEIRNTPPKNEDGLTAEFKCIFITNRQAFALFDVENDIDQAVFVRISLDEAERALRRGAMRCTVIDARH